MKKFIILCLLTFFASFNVTAQLFQWAKKQENSFLRIEPFSPFNFEIKGGEFLSTGNNIVAQTGLFSSPITFGAQTFISSDSLDAYLAVHDHSGNLLWAKQLVGKTSLQPSLEVDQHDNVIITGWFHDTLNIDGLSFKAGTANKNAVYIIKYNSAGTLLWARTSDITTRSLQAFGGESSITTDDAGNIYVAGSFSDTLRISGTNLIANQGNTYVVKFSTNGAFQWGRTPALSGYGINIKAAGGGQLFLSKSTIVTSNLIHKVFKLDAAGFVSWIRTFQNISSIGINLTSDQAGNAYISGYYWGNSVIGNTTLTSSNGSCFLAKIDAAGNWKWVKEIASGLTSGSMSALQLAVPRITVSPTNYIAVAGCFVGSAQFPGSPFTTSNNSAGIFIVRLDTAGTGDWVNAISNDSTWQSGSGLSGLKSSSNGNFFISGSFRGRNYFGTIPLNTLVNETGFIAKITNEANLVTGRAFIDANQNAVYDPTEHPFSQLILGTPQGAINGMSAPDGTYQVYLPIGNSAITIANPPRHYTVVPVSHQVTFTGINQTQTGKDFALQPVPNSNDVKVTVTQISVARPGSTFKYRITYHNSGTTILSDTVSFTHNNTDIWYLSATEVPYSPYSGKFTWYYQNLQPNETRNIDLTFYVTPNSVLGTLLTTTAMIKPLTTDLYPADNSSTITHPIVGSYDPNDKQVDKPNLTSSVAAAGEYLDYTIRFQNTGTDTAFTVVITDNISNKLALGEFEMLSASHPYTLSLSDNHTLAWRFDNILLPDSNRNEPESHGFVRFRIKSKSGLMLGDSIANKAAIYFDYNLPVITNYAVTKVADPLSIKEPKAGLQPFQLYPNPARNYVMVAADLKKPTPATVRLVNILGQTISEATLPTNNQLHYQLPLHNLPKGVYIVQLETEQGRQAQRLVVQ